MPKLRVGVIYGGRSGEHEVSVASGASILAHLDREKYDAVPVKIEKDGRWTLPERAPTSISAAEVIEGTRAASARAIEPVREALMPAHPGGDTLITVDRPGPGRAARERRSSRAWRWTSCSRCCTDRMARTARSRGCWSLPTSPYVGPGVMASAVGMDKVTMKVLFEARGLPVAPWYGLVRSNWETRRDDVTRRALALGLPLFVKPANLGSSVGISKVKSAADLPAAVEHALGFDRKVIVEAAVPEAREIECAVLGNDDPVASLAGEIFPDGEFYDYEAKYLDAASRTAIPADLTAGQLADVQRLSIAAFQAIDACGMSRVDFLLSRTTGALVLNEINTIPGFTTISMFAKLWEASGLSYPALVDRLIVLAIERHREKQRLSTSAL